MSETQIREAFNLAGYEPQTTRQGYVQHLTGSVLVRVVIDDDTYRVYVMTPNELVRAEAIVTGLITRPAPLAAIITAIITEAQQ